MKFLDIALTALLKLAIAFALLVFLVCLHSAYAKWKPQFAHAAPNVQAWYERQHNALGQSCCLQADGHDYYGNVTFLKDGSVELDGGYKIPSFQVLHGPNPTGHSVWFYAKGYRGGRTTYCFAPGAMG